MPLIPKPNYNQIFASQAPDIDKPAVFNNYPEGWGPESRPNNGKPTIKGFNYLQQTSDLKDLWILQNGACLPYDESIEYAEGAPVLKDGVIQYKTTDGFSPAISEKPYILKYFTEGASYPLNARVMLDSGDVVRSTVIGNTANPNTDMTGWKVADPSFPLANTYYAEAEGFKTSSSDVGYFDNSDAWDALEAKLVAGDHVIFGTGTYYFSRPVNIYKVIQIKGKDFVATTLRFPESTNGIIRHARGGRLKDFGVTGKQTTIVLDPKNFIFGSVGLYDRYDEAASFAGYTTTDHIRVNYFDTGRVNATEGAAIWNGAYRESYNCRIQLNRIGCVFLNGSTDDKYYGGIISANSEIGIWAYDDGRMYNNIKFIGTTIEGNGGYDTSVGAFGLPKNRCSIYSAGNSSVYLIGSYNEKTVNLAEDGGKIYKIGCHQHSNAVDLSINGLYTHNSISWGNLYSVPYYNRLSSFLYGFSGLATAGIVGSKALQVTSNLDQSGVGYSLRSRFIKLPSGISTNKVHGVRFRIKFKITSGFTANTGLYIAPLIYFYAKDGSYAGLREANFAKYQLNSGNGQSTDISASCYVTTTPTPANWNFNPDQELSHIYISISFKKDGATNPNFAVDNLDMLIEDIEIGIFSEEDINLTTWRMSSGASTERPILQADDAGYEYNDKSIGEMIFWSGSAWKRNLTTDYAATAADSETTALQSATSTINTIGKVRGRFVYNSTNGKMYYALNSGAVSGWRATDGSGDITPT